MKNTFIFRLVFTVFAMILLQNTANTTNITVSGTISSHTTWSADTIFVNGNVTVDKGITLTIIAGKHVIFRGHYGLYIQGRLLAEGTPTGMITFTALYTTTGWSGIRFNATPSTNDTSFITSCKILFGKANSGTAEDQMGGGIFVKSFSKLVVRNSMISNCYAARYGGAISCITASPHIINNVLCNNTAISLGGAICIQSGSNAYISNNSIVNNHCNSYSGGIDISSSTPIIKNCIFWGNTAPSNPQIYPVNYAYVTYSDVQGGWTGTGNINSDPKFINPSSSSGYSYTGYTADWKLNSTSPCKNKGSLSFPDYLPLFDMTGNLRIDYDTIDIGALEYIQSDVICGTITANKTLSKYVIVTCDVTVNNGVTLTFPAGAKVRFTGPYKLNINGRLLAVGTSENLIKFYPATSANPWKGIRFDNTSTANDTSKIEYCILQYSYANGTSNDNYGGAVFANISKLIIRNNYLTNNRAYYNGGAIAVIGGSPVIVGNLIANNTVVYNTGTTYGGGGIYLQSSSSYIINNTITRNQCSGSNIYGNGLYVASGSPILRNNIIWRNTYSGAGIINQLYPASGLNVQNSNIEGGSYSGTGNISVDPSFKSVTAGSGYTYNGLSADWVLLATSSIIGTGSGTTTGLYLPTLDLKGNARINGTIEPGAFEDFSSVNVCGQITKNTTWNSEIIHVTCNVTVKNGVTLTIAPGTKVIFDGLYFIRVNGRLLAVGTPTDSIKFIANVPATGWAGIRYDSMYYISPNNNDTSKFKYCRFEYCKTTGSVGGVIYQFTFNKVKIENSFFTNNSGSNGAAINLNFSNAIIRNCTFTNNSVYNFGGAIYSYIPGDSYGGGEHMRIENCIITNNSASGQGGGIWIGYYSSCKIINTVIANNSVTTSSTSNLYGGGGVYVSTDCTPNFINCTITNNQAPYFGGGFYCTSNADAMLKNCIVWGNTASTSGNQFYLFDQVSDPKIYYSNILGGASAFGGSGSGASYANIYQNNIDINPTFIAPSAGSGKNFNGLTANWRLSQGSRCINSATPGTSITDLPAFDLDFKKRIYNGRLDMGAYENQQDILACGTITSDQLWDADTIKVTCPVIIANGATLTITPGTYVQFQGLYYIDVQGRILANGTSGKRITFSVKDTNYFSVKDSIKRGGWQGIRFNSVATSNDSSKIIYCNLTYGKAMSGNVNGGALYIFNTHKLLVSNCYISKNVSSSTGSAIYIESSNPRILNNVICNNSLKNIYGSTGVVFMDDASPDFINNTVANNLNYHNTLFTFNGSAPLISNCIFNNNLNDYGYVIDIYAQTNSQPIIHNCIFTSINSCIINTVTNKQNIKYGNPQFMAPSAGAGGYYDGLNADWTLKTNTPCLNAGYITTSSNLLSEDMGGNERIVGDTIDLGAYEIQIHSKFITSQPVSLTACVGTKASFSISASIQVAYQWQKDGVDITGATSKNLNINSVSTSDSGYYRCIMSNQNGNIISDSAKLTVRTLPAITTNPTPTASACQGGIASFSVAASGSTPLTYQWYDLNGSVAGGGNPTYMINPVLSTSASTYRCIVTNNCGTAVSNGATLTINTPVSVGPITSSNSICVGNTVSLSTLGTGTTPITYKWYKNTTAISGATSFTYQITNAQTSQAGNYYCKATNVCGSDSTNTSSLVVNTIPAITYQSPTDSVCTGQSKTFVISASSSLPINYQWYFNSTTSAITGATNNIYSINSVASTNGGTYYCKATNSCGTETTTSINFTVKNPPTITTQSSSQVLCVTQQANFSVTATGTAPITYKWYKDNTLISGATNNTYQISSVSTSDAGNYYCVITNSCGSINSSVKTLTVNTAPSIASQSASDSVCLGASKSFSITATGSSPITYQWYYNTTSNAITGATNNFYTINSVATSHGGLYYCKATNSCGDATTSQIGLTIKTPPSITSQSSNLVLCATQQANFSVTATGTAPITYKWYKDNILISGAVTSVYTINSVASSDAGNYYCIVSNYCGTVNSSVKMLTVNTVPVITYQTSSDSVCQGQNISLNITASGSAPINYQWYYNTTSNTIAGATSSIYNINSITTSKGGQYYCKATNSCGTATTSQINLVIKTTPSITAQSSGAIRCVGQSQNFSVTATGSPAPKYQWFNNNIAISGASNNTYAISVVNLSDAGNYYCMISNSCGSIQSTGQTLTVNTPPDITSQSSNTTKCSGQSITLDVTSSGTVPIAYQWYHLGNPINGAVNNFYSLYNIDPADSGSYYCIASNTCGTDQSANISLKVNLPVSVYKQSRDTSKCVGDATLFNVQVRGTMPVYYTWYFEQDSITGAHSNILFMDSLTQANSGNYFCEMTNVCGTVQGAYKELTVRALPVVNLGNDTTFCLGGSIDLSADGPYYCKWNNGSTKSWLNVTHSGTFFVHVTDPYGCKNYSNTIIVTVIEPYPNQILCVVTVDPGSGKNLIAWERARGYRIASYNIYKETSQTGVYLKIGSLPFDSLSVFIDYASEPRKKADRYAITVVDSCGNESDYSPFHKTIHLTASKGASGTENNLNWNHYEGFNFNTYKIYRGTSPSNMVLIDSIASNLNSFTDMTAPNGIAFYQVSAVKPDTCYPAITRAQTNSGPYSQSVSNIKDYTQIPTGYISAAPADAYVGWKDGSTAFFNIYTNVSAWDANTGSKWFNIVKDFQNNILQAVVFQNYSSQPRSDTISITAAGLPDQTVVVHQEGTTAIAETLPDINLLVYPNPFNYSTNIEYEILNEAHVNIEVYNMIGTRVSTIIDQHQQPGKYNYSFNDAQTDGIYILRIVVNNNTYIKKLIKTE